MTTLRFMMLFLFAIPCLSASGGEYYWVGGSGNWSEISHWATSSGGSTFHSVVPGINDTVYFDANSGFTEGNNTVTINTSATCHTMIWDEAPNQPVLENIDGMHISVYGSLALQEAMTIDDHNLKWNFRATREGNTIKTSGHQLYEVEFNGSGGEWSLTDELSVRFHITLAEGSLYTNDQKVEARGLSLIGGRPQELHMGSSEITLDQSFWAQSFFGGPNQTRIYLEESVLNINHGSFRLEYTPEVFDPGTSTINIYSDGALSANLWGRETSFHEVVFHDNGFIRGSSTFERLVFSPGKTYQLQAHHTQTILEEISLEAPPCTSPIFIRSNQMHAPAYLQKESGTVDGKNLVLQDIHTRGDATFNAEVSVDLGNNDGWLFTSADPTDYYWIGGEGNWSDGSNWSLSSGGEPADCIPTAFDNVFFDSESGFISEANAVEINGTVFCNNMNWSQAPGHPEIKILHGGVNTIHVFGSLALQEAMNVDDYNLTWSFRASEGGQTIKTSGQQLSEVEFIGSGGEWSLTDELSVRNNITLTEGIFRTNDQEVYARGFAIQGGQPQELHLGNSEVTLNRNFNFYDFFGGASQTRIYLEESVIHITNYDFRLGYPPEVFDAGTSTINLYGEGTLQAVLQGRGSSFHNVVFHENGTIFGTNSFNSLVFSPGKIYQLQANHTQTIVEEVSLEAPPCTSPIFIRSNQMHAPAYLQKESGTVDGKNLVLQDIHAMGDATFHAEVSVDLGNNDGWLFTSGDPTDYYRIGGEGNWADGSNWSLSSGGEPADCIPTALDNVFFDSESGFTSEANAVGIDGAVFCNNMSWSDVPGHPEINVFHGGQNTVHVFGSLALQEEMNVDDYNLSWSFRASEEGQTIKTSGHQLSGVAFNGEGGEWSLTDKLSVRNNITLTEGSFRTNDQEIHARGFAIQGGRPQELHLGSSEVTLNRSFDAYTFYGGDNQTKIYLGQSVINIMSNDFRLGHVPEVFDAGTSTINMHGNGTLQGRESSFHNVVFFENGIIRGNNTFNSLVFSPGNTYQLEANHTQTVLQELEAKGNPCFITNLSSNIAGQQATIEMHAPDTLIVDFIMLRDIQATGGATFIGAPNTTNLANNSGWDFTTTPGDYIFGFGSDRRLDCDEMPYLITTESFNPNPGTTFLWNDNSSGSELLAHEFGQYHILVAYAESCYIRDTLELIEPPIPEVDLGPDVYLDPGESASLEAEQDEDYSYLWSTGETTPGIEVSEPGQYWVSVINAYSCEARDTIWVFTTPEVVTSIPEDITSSSAILGGEVLSDGGAGITERGVFWGTDPDPAENGTRHQEGDGVGDFSYLQDGLQPNTTYYVVAYAEHASLLVTGNTKSFTTLVDIPVVETADPSDVLATSAVVGGHINYDGGMPITERGVYWSTDSDPAENGTRLPMGDGDGDFSQKLEELSPNQLYYYVAFGTNDEGTGFGEIKSFTTLTTIPEVITSIPTDIEAHSATLGGEVITDGGAPVTERGIFWGPGPDPVNGGTQQPVGDGLGIFSYMQDDLQPITLYYAAAYAINSAGIALGDTVSFITADIVPEIFIPNAFMPGSNLVENQIFKPTFNTLPPVYSLTVFNRWGQEIFSSDNPEVGWDGDTGNSPAEHGSYSYIITYRYPNGKDYKHMGVFMLIR